MVCGANNHTHVTRVSLSLSPSMVNLPFFLNTNSNYHICVKFKFNNSSFSMYLVFFLYTPSVRHKLPVTVPIVSLAFQDYSEGVSGTETFYKTTNHMFNPKPGIMLGFPPLAFGDPVPHCKAVIAFTLPLLAISAGSAVPKFRFFTGTVVVIFVRIPGQEDSCTSL